MGKKKGKKTSLGADVENAEPSLPAISEEKTEEDGPVREDRPRDSRGLSTSASRSILKSESKRIFSKTLVIADYKDRRETTKSIQIPVLDQENSEKTEKEKKGKMEKKESLVAQASKLFDGETQTEVGEGDEEKEKKKGKKGKKDKKESTAKEKIEKAEQTEDSGKKKGKGKKDKKAAKKTEDDIDGKIIEPKEIEASKRESKMRSNQSKVSFHSRMVVSEERKSMAQGREVDSKVDLRRSGSKSDSRLSMSTAGAEQRTSVTKFRARIRSSIRPIESTISSLHGRKKWTSTSRLSTDTDYSSDSSSESTRENKEERAKKKKGKKAKKEKKKQGQVAEVPSETEEEREQKEAEKKALKAAKKAEKKAERLAAKQAAKQAKQDTIAPKKGQVDYENVKNNLEELRRIAKELGAEISKAEETDEKGPKKKMSKKEKAKLTADMMEKQKIEMEAETKRLEEVIKKKREEDRLAAIERDKRDTIQQGLRMEQLKTSNMLIQDIVHVNAEIAKKEKDLLEWQKYVECGSLPNPGMCNQMNTYLHLWQLVLENTSVEVASKMTSDGIKLLNDLDELIDTVAEEEEYKLKNWKWVRQLFREYQASSLEVATYRLLRDVEHNLNRINIPTADYNFKDDYVTLCIWLRVMLPIPLPNPRRPPKPRIDIFFNLMDVSVLFPTTIDCHNAAIRAMYLKYDHLSDLCDTFDLPDVPQDYHMDLFSIMKKEWRIKLKYKYDNRDKKPKPAHIVQEVQQDSGASPDGEQKPIGQEKSDSEKQIGVLEEPDDFSSDEEIPTVPFKQLKPTANEYAVELEDSLYDLTRANLLTNMPEHIINLRKFVILGGIYHLHLLAQPPQPQDFITMEMTITRLYLPKKLEVLPFQVVYTPYIPPEPPEPTSTTSLPRKLPEEIEEETKKQEEELDKLIAINIKWPPHVIFLELPIVCRWNEEAKHWSKEEIHDLKHNEEKCILSFRTGVFGIYGLAAYRYANLPFQAYDIKPELDDSITVQLTAAILMLEFNIKDGLISITQLQNSPNMTLQDVVGKYFKLHRLKRMMLNAGIDIFPEFDAFCYVDGSCEKQWAMEKHLYFNMAQISNSFNFAWSRWNLQAGRRKIVVQMRPYSADNKKQKSHQMLLVTPIKAAFIECTEVSQTFSDKEVESLKFCADLYHLMRSTSGIFARNKVMKASKPNVYTLAQFLISIRVLSFS